MGGLMSENNSSGCGCISFIIFALLIVFGYFSCTQKSFVGGAAQIKTKYENIMNRIDNKQNEIKAINDSCYNKNIEWIKDDNNEWVKICKELTND